MTTENKGYLCNSCNKLFPKNTPIDEIKNHLFECAIEEINLNPVNKLEEKIKSLFPQIEKIELVPSHDFEEPDYLLIHKKDGSNYYTIYQYKSVRISPLKEKEKTAEEKEATHFQLITDNIKRIENGIARVISEVIQSAPQSNIRFAKNVVNHGYAGNRFDFEIDVNGKTFTKPVYFKSDSDLTKFIAEVKSFYLDKIEGTLEKFNDQYSVNGISINQWLLNNYGQTCHFAIINERSEG